MPHLKLPCGVLEVPAGGRQAERGLCQCPRLRSPMASRGEDPSRCAPALRAALCRGTEPHQPTSEPAAPLWLLGCNPSEQQTSLLIVARAFTECLPGLALVSRCGTSLPPLWSQTRVFPSKCDVSSGPSPKGNAFAHTILPKMSGRL